MVSSWILLPSLAFKYQSSSGSCPRTSFLYILHSLCMILSIPSITFYRQRPFRSVFPAGTSPLSSDHQIWQLAGQPHLGIFKLSGFQIEFIISFKPVSVSLFFPWYSTNIHPIVQARDLDVIPWPLPPSLFLMNHQALLFPLPEVPLKSTHFSPTPLQIP